MGLLGYISQKAKAIPDNAKAAYRGLLAAPEELAALFSPGMLKGVNQAMNTPATLDRDKALGMAMDFLQTTPAGLLGHIVYHGSPHKFGKFDMSKIGTGEGAQAYGHGLYFAESPEVAKSYSKLNPSVSAPPNRIFNGQELIPGTPEYHAGTLLEHSTLAKARKDVARWIAEGSPDANAVEGWKKTLETLNKATKKSDFKVGKNENLYKVDIPDEAIPRMLDWDKPLSEQAPEVQAAILATKGKLPPNAIDDMGGDIAPLYDMSQTPGDFLGTLASLGGRQDFGEGLLKQAGIPGIRYLDGSSRGAGQGTSNFVLFDDQLPRILEVNGQPTGLLSYADEAAKKKRK